MKLLLCGYGERGRVHCTRAAVDKQFQLVAICDPDPRARERARNSRLSVFADLAEALERVRPDIVSLCTPPDVRMSAVDTISRAAGVQAVVIEKPLALSGSEARAIYETCTRRRIEVFVAHQLRFCEEFAALKEALASGRLGELREIHAACFGVLFDQGSHLVDQILWLTGDCPTSVDATACDDLAALAAVRPLPAGYQRDTRHPGPASTSAVLRFRSGALGVLTCGVLDAEPVPALGPWLQKRITLVGTRGVAHAHVASHFREVSATGQAPRVVATSQASYEDSLTGFYDAVIGVLAGTRAPFQTPEENIHVVDVLEAALESGRQRRPLAVGKQAEATAASAIERIPTREWPRVSVIMPLEDHRGMGVRAVESWTAGQRCDPRLFELIAIIDASTEYLESSIRALLRPGDRLVAFTADNEMEQYHHGAQLANGDILFFTEPHCLAEPDSISETIRFLKDEQFDGFCGRTTPICRSRIARMESRMYDQGFAEWAKPGNWTKVILRAFAIRKTVYFASGGYQYRFDRFSEWLLAATLHRQGRVLGYAPGVGVEHLYSDNFSLLESFIREFTDGECLFRASTQEPEFCAAYFGAPLEWSQVRSAGDRRRAAFARIRGLLRLLMSHSTSKQERRLRAAALASLRQIALIDLAGGWPLLLRYWMQAQVAKLIVHMSVRDSPRCYRAFMQFWETTTKLCRVRWLLASSHSARATADATTGPNGHLTDDYVFGFHPVEGFKGAAFRWSGTFAGIRVPALPPPYSVVLAMPAIRSLQQTDRLIFSLNETFVSAAIDPAAGEIRIRIEPDHCKDGPGNWLLFSIAPWSQARSTDPRRLGLPISGIRIESEESRVLDLRGSDGQHCAPNASLRLS